MQIIVLVDKQGETQTVVKGAKGSGCVKATEFLHSALGTITQDIPTEDYYEVSASQEVQNKQYEYQQTQDIQTQQHIHR